MNMKPKPPPKPSALRPSRGVNETPDPTLWFCTICALFWVMIVEVLLLLAAGLL